MLAPLANDTFSALHCLSTDFNVSRGPKTPKSAVPLFPDEKTPCTCNNWTSHAVMKSVQDHFFLPFPLTLGDVPFVATLLAREV